MAALQLREGYTVRKVGNTLKVVPQRKRKVAIVVEEKAMLKGIRVNVSGEFDMLRSIKATVLEASEPFSTEEMFNALKSVSGEFLVSQRRVQSFLTTLCTHLGEFDLIELSDGKYTQYSDELYQSLQAK